MIIVEDVSENLRIAIEEVLASVLVEEELALCGTWWGNFRLKKVLRTVGKVLT